jgi:hypothetical protein
MWRGSLLEPRIQLPALDASVAMYLQSVVNDAKSFAPVKAAALAAIAFFHKVNLYTTSQRSVRRHASCGTRR